MNSNTFIDVVFKYYFGLLLRHKQKQVDLVVIVMNNQRHPLNSFPWLHFIFLYDNKQI